MKKIIIDIDTNCLISFVSDRNANQQEKIAALFNKTKQLKSGVICRKKGILQKNRRNVHCHI